jgi:hypothetical protein
MRRRFWSDTRDFASTKLTTSRPPFRYLKVRVVDLVKAGKGQLLMLELTWGVKAPHLGRISETNLANDF